jgi:hypothetical protein
VVQISSPWCHKLPIVAAIAGGLGSTLARVPTASRQDAILKYLDEQIFDVITNGTGLMSGDRRPIPPADRWAIVRLRASARVAGRARGHQMREAP